MTKQPEPVTLFLSYAHKDKKLCRTLEMHLSVLKNQGLINNWSYLNVSVGEEWAESIHTHLSAANIILLLVSPDFLASEYCYSIELQQAIRRHEAREACVIPIILRPVDWKHALFSHLQALPEDGRPITQWGNRDDAFLNVTMSIRKVVEQLYETAFISRLTEDDFRLDISKDYTPSASSPIYLHQLNISKTTNQEHPKEKSNYLEAEKKAVNTYRITVLGASGSGKTSLLSSMYSVLAVQRPDTGFFIETTPEQRKKLNMMYSGIASGNWPAGTQLSEREEWNFTCHVRSYNGRIYSPLHFTYLDYAGGRITDILEDTTATNNFEQKIKKSNIFLSVLDGQRLLALMQKKLEADHFIYIELPNILQIMQSSEILTHFIITKWDLLQREYSLGAIRDRLLQIDGFNHFVTHQMKRGVVRLIPVSSVGAGFAELQADGSMQRIPGAYPRPFHIELPLCCVWSDILHLAVHSTQPYAGQEISLRTIKDKRTAMKYIANSCLSLILRLEEDFPESRLI